MVLLATKGFSLILLLTKKDLGLILPMLASKSFGLLLLATQDIILLLLLTT